MGKLRHPSKEPSDPPSLVPSPVAGSENVYEAIPMSLDHNAREEREHARLRKAHPGEDEDIVLCYHGGHACYVKGRLQPSRAFGDIHLKLDGKEGGRERGWGEGRKGSFLFLCSIGLGPLTHLLPSLPPSDFGPRTKTYLGLLLTSPPSLKLPPSP